MLGPDPLPGPQVQGGLAFSDLGLFYQKVKYPERVDQEPDPPDSNARYQESDTDTSRNLKKCTK